MAHGGRTLLIAVRLYVAGVLLAVGGLAVAGPADAAVSGGTLNRSGYRMGASGDVQVYVGRSGDKPRSAMQISLVTPGVIALGDGYRTGTDTGTPGICSNSYPSGNDGRQVRQCGLLPGVLSITGTPRSDRIEVQCVLDFQAGDCPRRVTVSSGWGNDTLLSRHLNKQDLDWRLGCSNGTDRIAESDLDDRIDYRTCERFTHPEVCSETSGDAGSCRTKTKDDCTLQAYEPHPNGSAHQLVAQTWFSCGHQRRIDFAGSTLYLNRAGHPDAVEGEDAVHDVTARANTWYVLTALGSGCATDFRHTTGILDREGWAVSLKVDTFDNYVAC